MLSPWLFPTSIKKLPPDKSQQEVSAQIGTSFLQDLITTQIQQLSFVWFPSLQATQKIAFFVTGPPSAAVPRCWSPQFRNFLTIAQPNSQKVAVFSSHFLPRDPQEPPLRLHCLHLTLRTELHTTLQSNRKFIRKTTSNNKLC